MKTRIVTVCMALFMAMSWNAWGQTGRSPKGRVTIPLKHGSDHPGKRTDADMERWRGYGLGQFIHWGVYAIPGGEWNGKTYNGAAEWIRAWREFPREEYDNLYKQFNPTGFDAKAWARMAKKMGAGYLIFTTKHHDGFCLWPSRYTDYTVAHTPYQKDIVGQVVDAYTAEGIDVYLYFSIMDWNQGGWLYQPPKNEEEKARWEGFKQFTRNQLLELLENYPQIKGFWFDGTWDASWVGEAEFAHELEQELRALHPDLIIGSRFRADEYGNRRYDLNGDLIGDYDQTWERDIPTDIGQLRGNDWDCCMTIPENGWGYAKTWTTYAKTPYELLSMLSECNSLGGNLVINFGPDGNGHFRVEEQQIAAEIGRWMDVNGEAIRDAEPAAGVHKQGWGFMTQKGNRLFLHVYNQPLNNVLRLVFDKKTYVPGRVKLLDGGTVLKVEDAGRNKQNARLFNLYLPEGKTFAGPFVVEVELIDNNGDQDAYQQAKV